MPDIAKLLAANLGGQGDLGFGPMTLISVTPGTRDPNEPSKGNNPTTTSHACKGRQGVRRSGYWQFWQNAQASNGTSRTSFVGFTILGATLPTGVTPKAGDRVVHKGKTYTIAADGASNPDGINAVWECMTRAPGG